MASSMLRIVIHTMANVSGAFRIVNLTPPAKFLLLASIVLMTMRNAWLLSLCALMLLIGCAPSNPTFSGQRAMAQLQKLCEFAPTR